MEEGGREREMGCWGEWVGGGRGGAGRGAGLSMCLISGTL